MQITKNKLIVIDLVLCLIFLLIYYWLIVEQNIKLFSLEFILVMLLHGFLSLVIYLIYKFSKNKCLKNIII